MTDQQEHSAQADIRRLENLIRENMEITKRSIRENTDMTKSIHQILIGQPEYKRAGLVEIVDRHEKLIIRGGATFVSALAIWEIVKAVWLHV